MLQKIKDLMKVQEEINKITESLDKQSEAFQSLKSENESLRTDIGEIKASFSDLNKSAKDLLNEFTSDLTAMKSIKNEIEGELTDLKLFKSRLNNMIKDELMREFRQSLAETTERLRADVAQYNDLKQNLAIVSESVMASADQLKKFKTIASHLKEKDFELEKYAKRLLEYDKNKLELMRKVDELEHLISRERRKR